MLFVSIWTYIFIISLYFRNSNGETSLYDFYLPRSNTLLGIYLCCSSLVILDTWTFGYLSERRIYILNFGHLESAERNLEDLGNLTNLDEIFTNSR